MYNKHIVTDDVIILILFHSLTSYFMTRWICISSLTWARYFLSTRESFIYSKKHFTLRLFNYKFKASRNSLTFRVDWILIIRFENIEITQKMCCYSFKFIEYFCNRLNNSLFFFIFVGILWVLIKPLLYPIQANRFQIIFANAILFSKNYFL